MIAITKRSYFTYLRSDLLCTPYAVIKGPNDVVLVSCGYLLPLARSLSLSILEGQRCHRKSKHEMQMSWRRSPCRSDPVFRWSIDRPMAPACRSARRLLFLHTCNSNEATASTIQLVQDGDLLPLPPSLSMNAVTNNLYMGRLRSCRNNPDKKANPAALSREDISPSATPPHN